jgi:hypothetical protein
MLHCSLPSLFVADTKCEEEKKETEEQKALFRCRWRKGRKEQKRNERNTHPNKGRRGERDEAGNVGTREHSLWAQGKTAM